MAKKKYSLQLTVMASAAIFIAFYLFIIICHFDGRVVRSEITTTLGKIIGTTFTTRHGRNISAFLQIPYAQSPIGNLRYEPIFFF